MLYFSAENLEDLNEIQVKCSYIFLKSIIMLKLFFLQDSTYEQLNNHHITPSRYHLNHFQMKVYFYYYNIYVSSLVTCDS